MSTADNIVAAAGSHLVGEAVVAVVVGGGGGGGVVVVVGGAVVVAGGGVPALGSVVAAKPLGFCGSSLRQAATASAASIAAETNETWIFMANLRWNKGLPDRGGNLTAAEEAF